MVVTVTFTGPGLIEDMLSEIDGTSTRAHRSDRNIYSSQHRLVGKTGEWLKQHKHSGVITKIETCYTERHLRSEVEYHITFKDAKLATLFKLTWL